MQITAKDVQQLRNRTGAGMMDCKQALIEAEGDFEKAIEILRKKGQKVAAKRADNATTEGSVFVWTSEDSKEAIGFALSCETEPVSQNEEFKALGQMILDAAVANKAATAEALLAVVAADGRAISEHITDLVGKMGEKMVVEGYVYLQGEAVVPYVHGTSTLVLVQLSAPATEAVVEAGRNIGMQITAMRPVAVSSDEVSAELIEKEREIAKDKARQDGKPEQILDRIADGAVKKFMEENVLLSQEYVKEAKTSVAQYLNNVEKGLTVVAFKRISTKG